MTEQELRELNILKEKIDDKKKALSKLNNVIKRTYLEKNNGFVASDEVYFRIDSNECYLDFDRLGDFLHKERELLLSELVLLEDKFKNQ
jgi:hypothetical protein